jgi:hypothetical protein
VDRLVRRIARQLGEQSDPLQAMVALIDARLEKNGGAESCGELAAGALAVPMPV